MIHCHAFRFHSRQYIHLSICIILAKSKFFLFFLPASRGSRSGMRASSALIHQCPGLNWCLNPEYTLLHRDAFFLPPLWPSGPYAAVPAYRSRDTAGDAGPGWQAIKNIRLSLEGIRQFAVGCEVAVCIFKIINCSFDIFGIQLCFFAV